MAASPVKLNGSLCYLKAIWLGLMGLTLLSALVAERAEPGVWVIVAICATVSVKGSLVVDGLMGLRTAPGNIRWVMLSYFIVLPPLIALALLFPEVLLRLTSL